MEDYAQDLTGQPAGLGPLDLELTGQADPIPVYESLPALKPEFDANELAEIELSRQIADGLGRKERLTQAKNDAQFPAIKRSIDDSRQRAEGILDELRTAREALNQPAPQLVQGQMGLGDLLASLGTVLAGGRADQVLAEGQGVADRRNQLDYQNQLQNFNISREQAGQLVDFLQRAYMAEGQHAQGLTDLGIRAELDSQQADENRDWQTSEAEKQRTFQERDKAWAQLYQANSEGEVMAAAGRLRVLDPHNAPDPVAVEKAVASARLRREQAALDYFKATVQRQVDNYQGVVPDSVKQDLEQRIQAIARQFDVDPKVFGEIPTAAYWKRTLDEQELQAKRDQWTDRLKFLQDKERNDWLVDMARNSVARKQAAIAQQNANTSSARLQWQKVAKDSAGLSKKIDGRRQSKVVQLRGIEKQLQYLEKQFGSEVKDKQGKTQRMIRFDKRKEYERLQLDWQQVTGEIQELDEALHEVQSGQEEAQSSTSAPRTYTTPSGAKFQIGG